MVQPKDPPLAFRPSPEVRAEIAEWAESRGLVMNAALKELVERGLRGGSPAKPEVSAGPKSSLRAVSGREVLERAEAGAAHLGLKNSSARTSPGASDAPVREKLRIPDSVQVGPSKPVLGSMLKKPKAPKGRR